METRQKNLKSKNGSRVRNRTGGLSGPYLRRSSRFPTDGRCARILHRVHPSFYRLFQALLYSVHRTRKVWRVSCLCYLAAEHFTLCAESFASTSVSWMNSLVYQCFKVDVQGWGAGWIMDSCEYEHVASQGVSRSG